METATFKGLGLITFPEILETLQVDPEDCDSVTSSVDEPIALITKGFFDTYSCCCDDLEATPQNPIEVVGVHCECIIVRASSLRCHPFLEAACDSVHCYKSGSLKEVGIVPSDKSSEKVYYAVKTLGWSYGVNE